MISHDTPQVSRGRGIALVLLDVVLLVAMFCAFGYWFVPAHIVTTHMDGDFTGWVVPISNRLDVDHRLYEDGLHSPMPPLPFVFINLLVPTHGTWLMESFWVYAFQCATLLVLYGGLSLVLPRPLPWLSVVSTYPIFLAIGKGILYDPLAQFWVAVLFAGAAWHLRSRAHESGVASRMRGGPAIVLMGIASAALLLTKQSTAAGAVLGALLFLSFSPAPGGVRGRVRELAVYAIAAGVAFLGLVLAMLPLVSPGGLIRDVYLTGAEPKGGASLLRLFLPAYAKDLRGMFADIFESALVTLPLLALFATGVVSASRRRIVSEIQPEHSSNERPLLRAVSLVAAAIVAVLVFVGMSVAPADSTLGAFFHESRLTRRFLVTTGLVALALLAVGRMFHRRPATSPHLAMGDLFLIAFLACVGHNLSRGTFYYGWLYDNNPLIALCVAFIFYAGLHLFSALDVWRPAWRIGASGLFTAAVTFYCWGHVDRKLDQSLDCTSSTDDVPYLTGAKFQPHMIELLRVVDAAQVSSGENGTVLVLPNDPDVEAMIDRPRPQLTSAILYADQYWDRYVDEDFKRLEADLPEVILIGPGVVVAIQTSFGHEDGTGAARFIKRVTEELIPGRYVHARRFMLPRYQSGPEPMDLYVLDPSAR